MNGPCDVVNPIETMTYLNFIPHPLVGTPYGLALDLTIVLGLVCWVLSIIFREYGWVDRIWSICPAVFCLIVAGSTGFDSPRVNVMTVLVCLWSIRLTYNYVRKGGFKIGGEDYRWSHIQQKIGPIPFQILNFVFINPVQLFIVWLFTAPVHSAWENSGVPLGWLDAAAVIAFALFWVGETAADNQMWRFQTDKQARRAAGQTIDQPFMTTGLFKYCRHPNFVCELGMWWVFYMFSIAATGSWVHWSAFGFIALTGIFIGSTRLTETISLSRYPTYLDYIASTPSYIPFTTMGRVKPKESA